LIENATDKLFTEGGGHFIGCELGSHELVGHEGRSGGKSLGGG